MPTPSAEAIARLQQLPEAVQMQWLQQFSAAILAGKQPPPLPKPDDDLQR